MVVRVKWRVNGESWICMTDDGGEYILFCYFLLSEPRIHTDLADFTDSIDDSWFWYHRNPLNPQTSLVHTNEKYNKYSFNHLEKSHFYCLIKGFADSES